MSMPTQKLHVPDLRKYEVIKTLICIYNYTWNVANTTLQGIATYVATTMNGKNVHQRFPPNPFNYYLQRFLVHNWCSSAIVL